MSAIASTNPTAPASHKQHLLHAVASKAKTGEISATDETALDSAIDTIEGSLSSGTGSSTAARLDPSQMKSRIDGFIADAVSNGTLTDKQATALKDIFSKDGDAKIGGVGGPPPGPPPADGPRPSPSEDRASSDADPQTAGTTASSTDPSGTDASSATDLLATFIKQLQASQSQGNAYTAGGSSSRSRTTSALLLDFEA